MKKELKSGILSADKSADHRPINWPTVGGVNVIAVLACILNSRQKKKCFFFFSEM